MNEIETEHSRCTRCGLPVVRCICDQIPSTSSNALFCLLLHENEWQRETNTGHLIKALLPETQLFTWQRNQPDPELIQILQAPELSPYLIFPADRPELEPRQVAASSHCDSAVCRPLYLILDGTWKEVRKILRKSPYLDHLPLLSINSERSTNYQLRRNPDPTHLCTAEIAIELLQLESPIAEPEIAHSLSTTLTLFQHQYLRYKDRKA